MGLDGDVAELTVNEDNGIGIAPSDLSRIFDRFERGAIRRSHTGLDMGQHNTPNHRSHGGSIHVESDFGQGSKFTVILPAGLLRDRKRYGQSRQGGWSESQLLVVHGARIDPGRNVVHLGLRQCDGA